MARSETIYTQIGRRLINARVEQGLSRTEMGKLLSMTAAGYGHWETGERHISIRELQRVAKVLGRPVAYFLGEDITPDQMTLLSYLDLPGDDQQFVREMIKLLQERSRRRDSSAA